MNLLTVLAIGVGGGIGAVLRYLVSVAALRLIGPGFPWGTLAVNVAGSLAMGVLVSLFAQRWPASGEMRAFLTTGILGGFTTFSAFSLDAVALAERDAWLAAAAYVAGSVAVSILALAAGQRLVHAWS